jgi:hypothetical protein
MINPTKERAYPKKLRKKLGSRTRMTIKKINTTAAQSSTKPNSMSDQGADFIIDIANSL